VNILLLITVCKANRARVNNVLSLLEFFKNDLSNKNITPIFVTSVDDDLTLSNYEVIKLDIKDKYTDLYRKLFYAYEYILNKFNFDFICKIDDDTVINFDKLDIKSLIGYDYIGRMVNYKEISSITININLFLKEHTFSFNPTNYYKNDFVFASGDCYFLSKKAILRILSKKNIISENIISETNKDIIAEDQLFGYMLNDEDIKKNNILNTSEFIAKHSLQVTKDWLSIHPVNESLYTNLIGKSVEEQQDILGKSIINYKLRLLYLKKLEKLIKHAVISFYNEHKTIGLG